MLSKYEIACVTMGVPGTGDPVLDAIITQGLRVKIATEILANNADTPEQAIKIADLLINEFRKKPNAQT